MLKLDMLRLFVDQRLAAATDDVFRCFARMIAEYEREVFRLKQETDRQRGLLEAAGRPGDGPEDGPGDGPGDRPGDGPWDGPGDGPEDGAGDGPEDGPGDRPGDGPWDGPGDGPEDGPEDRPEDRPEGVLQVLTTEEEQQVRVQSFSLHIKQEEALGPEGTDIKFTQSHDWLMERLKTDQSPLSNQIQSCREEAGPQPTVRKQEVFPVKQEVDEGHMMLEAAVRAEISTQQEGVLQIITTEEEPQVRGRSFSLHIEQDGGEASGPEETDTKFTQNPDWLMESDNDHIQFHREEDLLPAPLDHLIRPEPGGTCKPAHHNRDSVIQSESSTEDSDDTQSEPGLQRTRGTGTRPPEDQKLLVCGSCGREFSSKRTLRKHIRRNTSQDQDQMSCSLRKQRAPFQSPAKSFSCRVCGSSFYTQGILVRHAENHCKEPESWCGACGDRLESTETLRDHLRSHKEVGSTCDVCGKKCSSIRRMEIHKRVHTGEKPYRCGFCSRDFSRKESLERHLKVHSGDRPHRCGLCRRTFTRREYLVHHLKTGHIERPGPPAGTEGTEPFNMTL